VTRIDTVEASILKFTSAADSGSLQKKKKKVARRGVTRAVGSIKFEKANCRRVYGAVWIGSWFGWQKLALWFLYARIAK
jgi:hypothetical protein